MDDDDPGAARPELAPPSLTRRVLLLWASVALALAGCGLGLYDETGGAAPATVWPFVCPDGGAVAPDGGWLAPACPDGGFETDADGGCT